MEIRSSAFILIVSRVRLFFRNADSTSGRPDADEYAVVTSGIQEDSGGPTRQGNTFSKKQKFSATPDKRVVGLGKTFRKMFVVSYWKPHGSVAA